MRLLIIAVTLLLLFPPLIAAQQNDRSDGMQISQTDSRSANGKSPQQKKAGDMQGMPGMDHGQMEGMQMDQHAPMQMAAQTFLEEILGHDTSGTSAQPNSTPSPMLMTNKGAWRLMFHANVFVLDSQQSGPRGADRFFSTNWFMGMAQRKLGPGTFTVRAMVSLEPATVTGRRYPLLFQQGETAFGRPIADGQHPHDFIMELGALYDLKLGEKSLLSFYFAPMGDPAMGPTAYPHRASAAENPVGALGHHQEDSTHIADDVVTVGLTYRIVRIEASGFHGREPDEFRWNIDQGKIDSWSTRLTVQPGRNWSGQYSYGHIKSPEALFPNEDQERMTASVMHNHPLVHGNWASTLLWGRTRSVQDRSIFNSYLLESTLRFRKQNSAWTRLELVDRSNELLLGGNPLPVGFVEQPIARVSAYTFGYDRDVHFIPHLATAFGAQFTAYGVADLFKPVYGSHPIGVMLFLRFRPFSGEQK
jgi:hypothetical protein